MTFRWIILTALLASLGAGVASAAVSGDEPGRVGVIVDTTQGPDDVALRAAEHDVARLRAEGVGAELRVTRTPSESLAAAATLTTRGARTLIVRHVDRATLEPLV